MDESKEKTLRDILEQRKNELGVQPMQYNCQRCGKPSRFPVCDTCKTAISQAKKNKDIKKVDLPYYLARRVFYIKKVGNYETFDDTLKRIINKVYYLTKDYVRAGKPETIVTFNGQEGHKIKRIYADGREEILQEEFTDIKKEKPVPFEESTNPLKYILRKQREEEGDDHD